MFTIVSTMEKLKIKIIGVRVTEDVYNRIAAISADEYRTISQQVSMWIDEALARYQQSAKNPR